MQGERDSVNAVIKLKSLSRVCVLIMATRTISYSTVPHVRVSYTNTEYQQRELNICVFSIFSPEDFMDWQKVVHRFLLNWLLL